jgi:tetratricopeptide (TPR) repeat protein
MMINELTLSILFWIGAGLLPAGCVTSEAASRVQAQPATKTQAEPESSRSISALAMEHYLKAKLLEYDGDMREAIFELRQALVYDNGSAFLHARLGDYYSRQGLWRQAQKEAKQALQIDPNLVNAVMLKARALVHANKKNQAIKTYQKAVALDPKSIEAYVRLAELYLGQNQKDRALHILTEMTDTNPDSAEGFRRLADLHFEQGEEAKAEENYRRALQVDPADTRTTEVLSGLLEQQGRYSEAIEIFVDALETSPENPQYMAYMASLYLKAGDEKSANAYFDQLRANDPKNARLIAYAYSKLNLHAKAIRELTGLLDREPNLHNERLLLAYLYEERKEWDLAVAQLEAIPVESKFGLGAQINLGYCLLNQKKYKQAEKVLTRALDSTKDPAEIGRIYRYLAQVYAERKKFKEGLAMLGKAIETYPEVLDLVEAKANLLYKAKRGKEGVQVLMHALQKHPQDITMLYSLGALYEQMSLVSESLAVMRKVIEIDPNNSSALNFIGYTLADQGQELEEAEKLIRRALLLNPGNGAITDSLGWVLYRKGDYKQALEYLIRADRVSPGEAVIIMHIGDAYRKLGQKEKAIQEYRRALGAEPAERDRKEILKRFGEMGIEP